MSGSRRVQQGLVIALILGAAATRLLPHPPNFTAAGAITLFAGACLRPTQAVCACLGALLLSDALLGFYHPLSMAAVYAGSLAGLPIGRRLLQRPSATRLALAATAGALVFFIISNLGVWWLAYPRTPAGLAVCYLAALPFLGHTLLGNCCWLPTLFLLRALLGGAVRRLLPGFP